jgi:putative ABC transport system permease protein
MLTDLRYVVRSLLRTKTFTAVTVLTLALGIGAATAIFGVVDWVLFRSNPFSDRVVFLGIRSDAGEFNGFVFDAHYRTFKALDAAFEEVAAASPETINVGFRGEPLESGVSNITPNLLPLLGVTPALGRNFLASESVAGRDNVVLISDHFWHKHFGGAADVLGREVYVGDVACKVVGVLRPQQVMPSFIGGHVYRPLVYTVDPAMPWNPMMLLLGRLRPGVTREQVERMAAAAKIDIPPQWGAWWKTQKRSIATIPEAQKFFRPEVYWMLLGAVGFLYAIACLNAANLMLLRMLARRRDLGIRLAIGGGRAHILRLLLLETIVVTLTASALGLLVANWLLPIFTSVYQSGPVTWWEWRIDWRLFGALLGLSLCTAVAIVVVPAWRVFRSDISSALKDGGASLGESRGLRRLRGFFVVLQAAFAVVLLTGAGLMTRTFEKLEKVDLGIDTAQRARMQVAFPRSYLTTGPERLEFMKRLRDGLLRVPGVESVTYGSQDAVLAGYEMLGQDLTFPDGSKGKATLSFIAPDFLTLTGMHLKAGHVPTSATSEVLINETLARAKFGSANPIGQLLNPPGPKGKTPAWVVVGVVGDVRQTVRGAPGYHIYAPDTWEPRALTCLFLRLRRDLDPSLKAALDHAVYEFDRRVVAWTVSLNQSRDAQLQMERLALSVFRALSVIAIILAVTGILAVLAYAVQCRMSEFGVRLALGATPASLSRLVLGRGLALAIGGVVIGIGGALALVRFVQSLLYETPAADPLVLGGVAGLLLTAAAVACWIPALRAAKADVLQLLRSE